MKTYLDVPALHATASHIATINAKLETLTRARNDCWAQMLTAAARLYAAGDLTAGDLESMLAEMKEHYGPGFTNLWNASLPVQANRVKWAAECERRLANPEPLPPAWHGSFPIETQPAPPDRVAVVYVLFDIRNEPIYVGSTYKFRQRMSSHLRYKPEAVRWSAFRRQDREDAYEVEVQALKERMPPLNKKAAR